jgi:hypothetical protein
MIASVTKALVATAAMSMVQDGSIRLKTASRSGYRTRFPEGARSP